MNENKTLLWEVLEGHIGHTIEIVNYGDENISVEDMDQNEVIFDTDVYDLTEREDLAMNNGRAMEIINDLIDHLIDLDGGRVFDTIALLLDLGVTKEQMVEVFNFTESDVDKCLNR